MDLNRWMLSRLIIIKRTVKILIHELMISTFSATKWAHKSRPFSRYCSTFVIFNTVQRDCIVLHVMSTSMPYTWHFAYIRRGPLGWMGIVNQRIITVIICLLLFFFAHVLWLVGKIKFWNKVIFLFFLIILLLYLWCIYLFVRIVGYYWDCLTTNYFWVYLL